MMKKSKYDRILSLYAKLCAGEWIHKSQAAKEFSVNERTIQRDIDDIRAFFENNTLGIGHGKALIYDRRQNVYRLEDEDNAPLSKSELLAVCLMLSGEQNETVLKLLRCCGAETSAEVFIRNVILHLEDKSND